MKKFTFLIPVFNDWDSLNILLEQIDQEISSFRDIFEVVVLNDGSTIQHSITNKNFKKINLIKILNLKKNLGSQRALAIGLKYLSIIEKETNIILMDADGEDNPNLLKKIINSSEKFPNNIEPLFSERKKRDIGKTKMNLFKLLFHSLRIISVFKKRVYFASIIYILIFILIYFVYSNILFLLLIFLIIFFDQ